MYFTDTHVQIMSKGLLEPGEQLVSRSVIVDAPWYTFGMWLFHKTYLVLATSQRVVMVEHSRDFFNRGMKTDKVHSVPWSSVSEMKVKGLLKKKLRIVAQSNMRFFKGKMKIPNTFFGLLAPIQDNLQNARVLEQQFQSVRQLVAPAQQHAPQMAYAPQSVAPQLQAHQPSQYPPPSQQQQQQAWAQQQYAAQQQQQQQQQYAAQQQQAWPQQPGGPPYPQA